MIIVIVYSHVSEEFDFVNKEPGKHYGPRQIAVETQHELHDKIDLEPHLRLSSLTRLVT